VTQNKHHFRSVFVQLSDNNSSIDTNVGVIDNYWK